MSVFSMSPDCALKEVDFDAASDSTASGCMMSEPPSTKADRFLPPGFFAVLDSADLSLQDSLTGDSSTPSESDGDATAVDLSPVGAVGHFAGQKSSRKLFQVPPPPPPGLGHRGMDIYSCPPPGLHPISANAHVARPPPGLERATEATGIPAPPPELPPISAFSAPAVPEVPAWAAAGTSELAAEPFVLEPLPNMSMMGSVTNGQPLDPECEALFPFVNPVPGWSTCVVSDKLNPDDVSLRIADFAKHHIRENSPDRKQNLRVNGGLQSRNFEGCWQQVPQIPQVDNFNGLKQNDGCQLAYGSGTPMWNAQAGWQQDPNTSHDSNLSRPPYSNGTFCPAQQWSSAYNSDMHQELNFHHSLGRPEELYVTDAFQHHSHYVDPQGFTEFTGDLTQNCGAWNMQTSSRHDYFGPNSFTHTW